MLLAPPPPEFPDPRSGLRPLTKRSPYGEWSSSGQSSSAFSLAFASSGQSRMALRRQEALARVLECLLRIPLLAKKESIALQAQAFERAFDFLINFHHQISSLQPNAPHLTVSAEGEIVAEWRNGEKQLVFYFEEYKTTFLKAWGTNIYEQMEEGEIFSLPETARLWQWLNQ